MKYLEKVKLKRKLKRAIKSIATEKNNQAIAELEKEKLDILDKINYIKVFSRYIIKYI